MFLFYLSLPLISNLMKPGSFLAILICILFFPFCTQKDPRIKEDGLGNEAKEEFFIAPGKDEAVDSSLIKKGEVLVAYSDCYQCHKEESKAKGPSFSDIAKRYPVQEVYLDLLARKIISGGSGTWGYPIMSAHPKLNLEDAKAMAAFVLSLEKK